MSQNSTTPSTPWVKPMNPSAAPTNPPPAGRQLSLPDFRSAAPGLAKAESAAVAAALQGEVVLTVLSDPAGSSGLDAIARLLAGLVSAQQETTSELTAARTEIGQLRSDVALLRREVASLKRQP